MRMLFASLAFVFGLCSSADADIILQSVDLDPPVFTVEALSGSVEYEVGPFDYFSPSQGSLRVVGFSVNPIVVIHATIFTVDHSLWLYDSGVGAGQHSVVAWFTPPSGPGMGSIVNDQNNVLAVTPDIDGRIPPIPPEVGHAVDHYMGGVHVAILTTTVGTLDPLGNPRIDPGPEWSGMLRSMPFPHVVLAGPGEPDPYSRGGSFSVALSFEFATPSQFFDSHQGTELLYSHFDAGPFTLAVTYEFDPKPGAIPEPSTLLLLGLGASAVCCGGRAGAPRAPGRAGTGR